MSEEVQLLADLINLRGVDAGGTPLHRQLYNNIRDAIMSGTIQPKSRLPSSRALANSLHVSRNTIVSAYDQLLAEGFLSTATGSGTYVSELSLGGTEAGSKKRDGHGPSLAISKRLRNMPDSNTGPMTMHGDRMVPGLVDAGHFPYNQWNRLHRRYSKDLNAVLPQVDLRNGYLPLCRALSRHLAVARGINARPEQIFITAGAAQSITLITKVLSDPGDVTWMEEPGYPVAAASLELADLQLQLVPVDHNGLNPKSGKSTLLDPRLIYTTTSYQYPLGFTMPVSRRLELINIASEKGAWIIEDDYDGEFRYRGSPIPSLFGLEANDRTLYMGTFSKSMSLALRLSFIVVPPQLVGHFQYLYPAFGNLSSMATQAAMAEFFSRGFFARHIEQMRKLYGGRRRVLEQCLLEYCDMAPDDVAFNPGGLHITVQVKGPVPDTRIVEETAAAGLGYLPLSENYRSKERQQGLLLGFTSSDSDVIEQSMKRLQRALQKYKSSVVPITTESVSHR